MNVFQLLVNLAIAIVACVAINYLMGYVEFPLEGLVTFLLCAVAVVVTFKYNAAAQLGV